MAEYKNGVNAFGNMSVGKEDRSAEVKTGRAVFVDEDKYANDPDYKLKVDKCLAEGFHRVGESGGGSSDFSTATVTINSGAVEYSLGLPWIDLDDSYIVGGLGSAFLPTGTPVTVPLYKGKVDAYFFGGNYTTVTTTGNATYDSGGGFVTITGDCTITIS